MKKKKLGKYISIDRSEQWEWTATCGDYSATGSSEQNAELKLLRLITGLSVKTAAQRNQESGMPPELCNL